MTTAAAVASLAAQTAELEPLHDRQRLVAVVVALSVVLLVFELIRRRKLREEYAWVWITTAGAVLVLAFDQDLLLTLSGWVGAASTASTLFFGALVFLMALAIQFSVRLSRLTHRQRTLAQRLALLEEEVHRQRRSAGRPERAVRDGAAAGRDEVA